MSYALFIICNFLFLFSNPINGSSVINSLYIIQQELILFICSFSRQFITFRGITSLSNIFYFYEFGNYQPKVPLILKINICYLSFSLVYTSCLLCGICTHTTTGRKIVFSSAMNLRLYLGHTNIHSGAKLGQNGWFFGIQKCSGIKYAAVRWNCTWLARKFSRRSRNAFVRPHILSGRVHQTRLSNKLCLTFLVVRWESLKWISYFVKPRWKVLIWQFSV